MTFIEPPRSEELREEAIEQLRDQFEATSRSIKRVVYKEFPVSCLNLFPIGDAHYGDPAFDEALFKQTINNVKYSGGQVILMGDLIENANRNSVGAGVYHQEINPMDQYKQMLTYLNPIRDRVLGILIGNHEDRVFQDCGFNVTELMARELGVDYLGWGGYFVLKVKSQVYKIFATHGSSGSRLPEGKLKACKEVGKNKDVDLVLMGHVHEIVGDYDEIECINPETLEVYYKRKYFETTGHFMGKYNGEAYYMKKSMPKTKLGSPVINLFGELHKIDVIEP
ncbi:MAG: metallophosphoesterase [Patescibacteria group bacterium]|jgi:predicted phosphodiesterase